MGEAQWEVIRWPTGGSSSQEQCLNDPSSSAKWVATNAIKTELRQKLDYPVNQLNIWFARPGLNQIMETKPVSKVLPFRNQRVGFSEFFWFLKHLKLSEMMTAWAYFAPSDGFKFNFNGKKRCRPQSLLHSRKWKLPTSRCILIFIFLNWRMGAKTLLSHSGIRYSIDFLRS